MFEWSLSGEFMRKVLYIAYQPYKWLVLLPLVAVSTLFFSFLAIGLSVVAGQRAGGMSGVWWARFLCLITPMRVKAGGLENIDRKQSYIIVANHQSFYDVIAIFSRIGMDIKFVMKKELRKVPGMGVACEKLGYIYVDRADSAGARASLQEAKKRIVNGTSVLFFPEGTRSETGRLGEFKKGAFIMALDLGLPILPVTVSGTRNVLPPTSLKIFPGRARLTVHPPVDVSGYSREDMAPLIDRVKAAVQSGL